MKFNKGDIVIAPKKAMVDIDMYTYEEFLFRYPLATAEIDHLLEDRIAAIKGKNRYYYFRLNGMIKIGRKRRICC